MNKRNINKKKRFSSAKNSIIERGTGNVEQILKIIGFRRKNDPDRLTASEIRDFWTRNVDMLMAEKRRNYASPLQDKRS